MQDRSQLQLCRLLDVLLLTWVSAAAEGCNRSTSAAKVERAVPTMIRELWKFWKVISRCASQNRKAQAAAGREVALQDCYLRQDRQGRQLGLMLVVLSLKPQPPRLPGSWGFRLVPDASI
jgi:hypothetical protein